jgi:hypothetical protein
MLRKYTAVLLATMLIAGPAFAQTKPTLGTSNPASTGGGSFGYNETLVSTSAQTPSRPPPLRPTRATPATNLTSRMSAPNLASSRASTGGGSSSFNEALRPQ